MKVESTLSSPSWNGSKLVVLFKTRYGGAGLHTAEPILAPKTLRQENQQFEVQASEPGSEGPSCWGLKAMENSEGASGVIFLPGAAPPLPYPSSSPMSAAT